MILLSQAIAALGILVLIVAAIGVLRLPDALSRQHAATKAGTIGISLFTIGLMIYTIASGWSLGWSLRLLLLLMIILATLPLASHALARASLEEKSD